MLITKKLKKQWQNFEHEKLSNTVDIPNTLMLELTNSCNLACTMCMNPKMTRAKGFMSIELVEKLMKEAQALNITNIALYTTGESLLHPKVFEIIKICKKYDRYVYLTTNALLLNKKKITTLLETGIDSIKYSIDGVNKEEYEAIRIGGKYEKVLQNIKDIKHIRDTHHFKTKLSMGIILSSSNIEHKEDYIHAYQHYVDEIIFSLISNQSGHISKEDYETLKPSKININYEWKPCRQLWDRIVITYDGKLTTCCIDFEAVLTYADLNKESLYDAWNNAQIKTFRKEHIDHNFKQMKLCQTCDSPYIQQSSIFESLNAK